MNPPRLDDLLFCLARALHGEQRQAALAAGLLPVQWAILCYLRDANRYSNTPQALADFLGLTKGTVSQSLKLVEARGWVARRADPADRRVVRIALTAAGRRLLDDTAEREWQAAVSALPAPDRAGAERALALLLAGWQRSRGGRTFGVCRTCAHFQPGRSAHRCGLTGEPLDDVDGGLICREHCAA